MCSLPLIKSTVIYCCIGYIWIYLPTVYRRMVEPTKIRVAVLLHKSQKYVAKTDENTHVKIPILPSFTLEPKKRRSGKFYYGVRIVTGDQSGASPSNASAYIKLTGATRTTGNMRVGSSCSFYEYYFGTASFDDILIECDAELDIDVFTAGVKDSWLPFTNYDYWYIDFMQTYDLQKDDAVKIFPCYHWIGYPTTEVSCTSQTSTFKDIKSNSVLTKQRKDQIAEREKLYLWHMFPSLGLPSCINEDNRDVLPQDEEFEISKKFAFYSHLGAAALESRLIAATINLSQAFEKLFGLVISQSQSVTSLDKYEEYAIQLRKYNQGKETIDRGVYIYEGYRWVTDVEFGRQIMNGVNPIIIKRCTALPSNFPVTDEMVQKVMPRGSTLSNEMKIGRVYICDLSDIMDGLACREGCYCPAPICLLHVNTADQLVPIAIQLKRDPGPNNPIFLPTDPYLDWLLAKIYYRCAENQDHQLSTHYILCHATMEAYCVALMRTLPDPHPVHRLLRPHFRYTLNINSGARAQLLNEGGVIDQSFSIGGAGKGEFIKRYGRMFNVHVNNIKRSVKERGVDDPNVLPGYYYRDDGLKIWNAIEAYVKDIIDMFYSNDADVKGDPELQNWAKEVHYKAFPAFGDNPAGRGFPESINTKDELIEYCALIIFNGSAQHAAVNFGQFDLYGYIPNSPTAVRQPPPNKKGTVSYTHLLNSLPDTSSIIKNIAFIVSLVQYSPNEIFIGGFSHFWFAEKEVLKAQRKLLSNLQEIEEEIAERNKTLDVPYEYMLPSQVPNSVTI